MMAWFTCGSIIQSLCRFQIIANQKKKKTEEHLKFLVKVLTYVSMYVAATSSFAANTSCAISLFLPTNSPFV